MSLINTINFLPEVFRSPTNQRFLGATLDHLYQPDDNQPINGYIGRTFSPTYKVDDNYLSEITAERKNYQLEASVTVTDKNRNVLFNSGYVDLLNAIRSYGGITTNQQRLFSSSSYSFNGHFNYDKFVNYYDYYWLPDGPAAVPVSANGVSYSGTYKVTRNTAINGYIFSNSGTHPNTQLTLARGGVYTFEVDQPGYKFWIQSLPGTAGVNPIVPTLTTRQVLGVTNNGVATGSIQFKVPLSSAQNFYTGMEIADTVNAAVNIHYTDIQNQLLSTFLARFPTGLDGISNPILLQNATFILTSNDKDDSYWTTPNLPIGFTGTDRSVNKAGDIIADNLRPGVWQIDLVPTGDDYLIQISSKTIVPSLQRVLVGSGIINGSKQFWLDTNLDYKLMPPITAIEDYLYYQDESNPDFTGSIKLVDNSTSTIDIDTDIIGKKSYVSPTGVVFTNGLKVQFDTTVTPATYAGKSYYVEGVGSGIALISVDHLVVPEAYGANIDTTVDYITISRASIDRNPWTRFNRWFHKDVIFATAEYNGSDIDLGPNLPARRPIIEFDPNLQLFQFGKVAKSPVDYITFEVTDAFNTVEGQAAATVDGRTLVIGDKVIFANDYNISVRGNVYEVVPVGITGIGTYLTLVKTADDPILAGELTLIKSGSYAGNTYAFNGTTWYQCQVKTDVNQEPLFDLVDLNGYSFSNTTVYPDSDFTGTRFFGYNRSGTGTDDTVLEFPLTYRTFNNIGDIVFKNYYDSDTFTYTLDRTSTTVNCNTGYLVETQNNKTLNNWIKCLEPTTQSQLFTKFFDNTVVTINDVEKAFVQIDILPTDETVIPHLKVYINNKLLTQYIDYEITKYGIYDIVLFTTMPVVNDKIDVEIISDSISALGNYTVPSNLDINPLNENFNTITLGQLRTHYNKLIENTTISRTGTIPLRDNYLKDRAGTLLQHNSPLIYAMTFLNDPVVNFNNGLDLARKEYAKFKNKFLSLCSTLPGINYNDPAAGVDMILLNINSVKNISFPWYYSDMVPQGGNYQTITYNVLNARQTQYEITSIFDATVLSNRAILVYANGVQQQVNVDYIFSTQTPSILFTEPYPVGTELVIRDYANTDGNFIPETPSKLGLYPKFVPEIYFDDTYITPTDMIRGHDGSLTPIFGDFRDQFLIELENRIYNNIKVDYTKNQINQYNIIPGKFRKSAFSLTEYNRILGRNFLAWCGNNHIDYRTNRSYNINDSWTWNYINSMDIIDGSKLQGSWRATYYHWFDTDSPHLRPWEMLGISSKPSWWETRYGPAPYTKGNTLLWSDLEAGYVWNDNAPYYDDKFARPNLTKFIPVDTSGNLVSPASIPLVKQINGAGSGIAFAVGQQGPAEVAWRHSSDYPYAIQSLLSLTTTAEYFSTQIDTNKFKPSLLTGQFTTSGNQKINPLLLVSNGQTVDGEIQRTSGYLNWIGDYIRNLGIDPTEKLKDYFSMIDVQLNYKVGGFTDNKMLTVIAEQTSPASRSPGVIIPESNYKIYLNKSSPVARLSYSAVIVEKTDNGYSVSGYDLLSPFFVVDPSIANNKYEILSLVGTDVKIYQDGHNRPITIPYGTEFTSKQQVVDFLISYERSLVKLGFIFKEFNTDLQEEQNWKLSAKEFLYWSQQGWETNSIIVLNPISTKLTLVSNRSIVDEITNLSNGNRILDQNFLPIKSNTFNMVRVDSPAGNTCEIATLDGSFICHAKLNLIQHEHVLIFDNQSDFGDIIYIPSQGTRQFRLKLTGYKTGGWTGALDAPGYIYNDPILDKWQAGKDYRTGDLVTYNGLYYTATYNIPAADTFSTKLWSNISKSSIQTGLLQNFSLNAQQFENIYDVDRPPSNETFQAFSSGLLGFRQRQYLTDLGISIPTQTKFYQGYIKEKGSLNAITALTSGNFNNVSGNLSIYEEWAFRTGTYGGIHSNTFSEYILNQSDFKDRPVVALQITDNYNTGNVIANLMLANVYNSSNLSSTSNSLYSNRTVNFYPDDVPSVGYVNLDDVDSSIFDLSLYTGDTSSYTDGTKIWTAKNSDGNWDILRATDTGLTATKLTYSLDYNGVFKFDDVHTFSIGDTFILNNFHPKYNGLYTVINSPTSSSVTVTVSDKKLIATQPSPIQYLIRSSPLSGAGNVYSLPTARVTTANVLIEKLRSQDQNITWQENEKVWVDNATTIGWGVYAHSTSDAIWVAQTPDAQYHGSTANTFLGRSLRISSDTKYAYIGDPINNKVYADVIVPGTAVSANITKSETGFGSVIESQGNLLAVGSRANITLYRHQSNTVTLIQTLASSNVSSNISSISMPADGSRIYVGGNNIVETWRPIIVTVLNTSASAAVWAGNIITQTASGASGKVLSTSSGNVITLYNVSGTFVNSGSNRNIVRDASNLSMNVTSISSRLADPAWANVQYEWTAKITSVASGGAVDFGNVVKVTNNGTTLFVSAPGATASATALAGQVYVYTISGNTATANATLSSSYTRSMGYFGRSLATDHNGNIFIGAPGNLPGVTTGYGTVERFISNRTTGAWDHGQTIFHPNGTQYYGNFGVSIGLGNNSKSLIIGSANIAPLSVVPGFSAVYVYEPIVNSTIANDLSTYIYVDQIGADRGTTSDQYGRYLDIVGNTLVIGAPYYSELYANAAVKTSYAGTFYAFNKPTNNTVWNRIREQQPKVDIDTIGRTLIYNKMTNNVLAALDYIDPAKGKILDFAAADIDYRQIVDPATYNVGGTASAADLHWGPKEVGKIWWNLKNTRYIDYEQDSLIYRLANWGRLFPGASVDVYQWVESNVLPSLYIERGGEGTPLYEDDSNYSTYGYVTASGAVNVKYYFWVININTVNARAGKQNSIAGLTVAIKDPTTQGVPYAAVLKDNSVALYNVSDTLVGQNSVANFTKVKAEGNLIHNEYALVQEENPQSNIPISILEKLIDSLAGVDQTGNIVPDPALKISQRYGLAIRPRQTMIVNNGVALSNYLTLVNLYLKEYPVTDRKVLTTLKLQEIAPTADSGEWDETISYYYELDYLDTTALSVGYNVLVLFDINNQNKWAIYTLGSNGVFVLSSVQAYKTDLYWSYVNWYNSSYDPTSIPDVTVDTILDLGKLVLQSDTYILVLDSGNGKFAVYYVDATLNLQLVGVEDGTLQISTDTIPGVELRNILHAIQQDILIDDLADKFNKVFFTMIKYILSEQKNIDWAFKTSFITAIQRIRKLEQFPTYIPDNQDFYLKYMEEVKPYRTVIREFVVDYVGTDVYGSDITDFDLPPYYDRAMQVYRSPSGEQSYDGALLTSGLYSQWSNNYKYKVVDIIMEDSGQGYIIPPQVVIQGAAASHANAYAILDSSGGVSRIVVVDGGKDYVTTPNVTINGAGTGAKAHAILRNIYTGNNNGHNLVRSIKTSIKLDRTTYTNPNTFVFWETLTSANVGQTIAANCFIVLKDSIYKLSNTHTISANITFPISFVSNINANSFTNSSDRIVAYSGANVDLSLTTSGIDYPGVTVDGNTFIGGSIDSYITSLYQDNLGINPDTIIVDGGRYVSTFSSHAPEELVPSVTFDSLNMVVTTKIKSNTTTMSYRILHDMNTDATAGLILNLSGNVSSVYTTDDIVQYNVLGNIQSSPVANITSSTTQIVVKYTGSADTLFGASSEYGNIFIAGVDSGLYVTSVRKIKSPKYYGISAAHTTTLASNLSITDSNIRVVDASKLTSPNPALQKPGVVFINGEKVHFYTVDLTNNILGRIRRAVDGTGTPQVHIAGSSVVDTNEIETIPGGMTVHATTWLDLVPFPEQQIATNTGVTIADNFGNIISTTGPSPGAVTSGIGLENSSTIQSIFIKNLQ